MHASRLITKCGHEQRGARYAVVVRADQLLELSTTLVAPTSTSARPASFRPIVDVAGQTTLVLVEQTTVVNPQRLGRSAGRLGASELRAVEEALGLIWPLSVARRALNAVAVGSGASRLIAGIGAVGIALAMVQRTPSVGMTTPSRRTPRPCPRAT